MDNRFLCRTADGQRCFHHLEYCELKLLFWLQYPDQRISPGLWELVAKGLEKVPESTEGQAALLASEREDGGGPRQGVQSAFCPPNICRARKSFHGLQMT